ncbi:hypothetical protein ALC56_11618 [Trachymyrmex septentrionalis]|uniref:Uncharacterized protein n=1 Tax=Trachymyrmex septentrionalis TaxID=34720 RepID=A0A195F0W5_9HYME|nr:hypothetical protein ALC56_11618 [Trachymyrmex septentrionalis]
MARRGSGGRPRGANGDERSREGNDRRRLSMVDDSRDFMIRYIEGESEEVGGEPRNAPREGTVEPTPNAGLLGSPLPRVRRDGNLAESFAIYDGVKRTAAPSAACTYFGLYASKMNSVICRRQGGSSRKGGNARGSGRRVGREAAAYLHEPHHHASVMPYRTQLTRTPVTRNTCFVVCAFVRGGRAYACERVQVHGIDMATRGRAKERVVPGCESSVPMIFLNRSLVNEKSTR